MALKTEDILQLEVKVRLHANDLRKQVSAEPPTTPAIKLADDALRAEAKAFDQVGDLLMGLQGCWEHYGGDAIVRDGYKRMSRAYDRSKTYTLAVEVKTEAEATEAAA